MTKLTKKALLKAVTPGIVELGYTPFKTSFCEGLFAKKVREDLYLTLGLTIHRFYDDSFTGDYYLSTTTDWAAVYGDIPHDCYRRIGLFLDRTAETYIDKWWEGLVPESVADFIESVHISEPIFIDRPDLIRRIRESKTANSVYDEAIAVINVVKNINSYDTENLALQPDKSTDGLPPEWFKGAELVLKKNRLKFGMNAVKYLAGNAYRMHVLDQLYQERN